MLLSTDITSGGTVLHRADYVSGNVVTTTGPTPTKELFARWSMFPLSSARVQHTSHEMNAQTKTWSTHKRSSQKCFLHIFHTSRYKYR